MNKVKVFCCSTMYHVFISSLIAATENDFVCDNILLLDITCYPNADNIDWNNLSPLFTKSITFNDSMVTLKSKISYINYRKSITNVMERQFPYLKYLRVNQDNMLIDIYLCEDGHNFSRYFVYNFKNITMLEEGMQIYKSQVRRESRIKRFIKYKLLGIIEPNGVDKRIKTVKVQYPDKLPDKLKNKSEKIILKDLIKNVDSKHLIVMKRILGFNENIEKTLDVLLKHKIDSINNLLLVTQPFSEDLLVSENQKIEIYNNLVKDMIESCQSPLQLIIKPHPRENTDYKTIFPDAIVIPNSFPLELLRFFVYPDYKIFKYAITVDSTAIMNIKDLCYNVKMYKLCEYTQDLNRVYPLN